MLRDRNAQAYLDRACGGDDGLRRRVEALLGGLRPGGLRPRPGRRDRH